MMKRDMGSYIAHLRGANPWIRKFVLGAVLVGMLVTALFLTGCGMRLPLLTDRDFHQIEEGTPIEQVVYRFGEPFKIHSTGEKEETFTYIERVEVGDKLIEFRKYTFTVRGGIIVKKERDIREPAPFDDAVMYD